MAYFEEIDRLEPTRRPTGRVVMRQQWRELLFLHWPVPIEELRPLLPPQLSLDTFDGQAYIGLVPFTMRNVRPTLLPPFPPLSNFHEINVRTYVHYQGREPGVWFFSLDAANAIAVRIARAWFALPYYYANMTLRHEQPEKPNTHTQSDDHTDNYTTDNHTSPSGRSATDHCTTHYTTERLWPNPLPACSELQWTPAGEIRAAEPGTLDHFLIERYILYAEKKGELYRGKVHHSPYPVQTAILHSLQENLIAQAGIMRPETPPHIHYASGVDVSIYPLQKVM